MKQKTQMNEIVAVDEVNYQIGLNKLNYNLEKFIGIKDAFTTITGNDTITTIDALNTLICAKSGFPNLEASIKLMDFETSYNYIVENYDNIEMSIIDTETNQVPKEVLEAYKEECTIRLSDKAQTDYPKLIQIAKLYNEIKNSDTLHSIFSTDNRITWNVNLQSLNQIDRNIQRPM